MAKMTFDEKINWLLENVDSVHTYDNMCDMIKSKIDDRQLFVALHILEAVNEDEADYYEYDYNMGTLETLTAIDEEYADYLLKEYGYTES